MIDRAELVSVADDEVVICYPAILGPTAVPPAIGEGASSEMVPPPEIIEPARFVRYHALQPGTEMNLDGVAVRTLPRPAGERLATVATVNDLHFGERVCGELGTVPVSPILCDREGDEPHALVMNTAAVFDIDRCDELTGYSVDAVVAKGDITDTGAAPEFEAFLDLYSRTFGSKLSWIRGNHDATETSVVTGPFTASVVLDGVVLALLETVIPGSDTGTLSADQLDWLDELASRADRPVMVFGHHHPATPGAHGPEDYYFGIDPVSSEALVSVVERRPTIAGYFAGHTHRNRIRYFPSTGPVPFVEVASVKDFPGSWAEYRIFEGGILQVHRRATGTAAVEWSESTRVLYGGMYVDYAFGSLVDRCVSIELR